MRRLRNHLAVVVCGLAAVLSSAAPAAAQVPADSLEVILAIDTSGSMRPAIDAAKAAATEFVAAMPAGVRIGLETFDDEVTVLTPPTVDRDLLIWEINAITTGGDTALYDIVVTASQHFTPSTENKVLVLLSDGKDEGSTATLDDAIAAVAGVHVEAISLTTALTDITSLSALGQVTPADDAASMSAAFARIASLLALVVETAAPIPATTVAPTTVTPSTVAPTTVAPATAVTTAVVTTRPPAPAGASASRDSMTSNSLLWLGTLGIFVGLFVLGLLVFPRERVSKARLGIDKPRSVSDMGQRTMSAVEQALERHGKRSELATTLSVADISIKPAEFVAMVVVIAVVAGLVGLLLWGPLAGLLVTLACGAIVRMYVRSTKAKRQAAFADQLPDVLQLVTTALRSGFGLTQALDSVAEEAEEPARSEFAHVLVETRLGRDLSDAMHALARRMQSEDLEWVVAAIDINRDTGGNLSETLNTVGSTIRERQRMARQVATLTAEGRLSARILTVFPLLMALWQWRTNPDAFALMTEGGGLVALAIAALLIILGTIWTHKIVNSLAS